MVEMKLGRKKILRYFIYNIFDLFMSEVLDMICTRFARKSGTAAVNVRGDAVVRVLENLLEN